MGICYLAGFLISIFCLVKKKLCKKSALLIMAGSLIALFFWAAETAGRGDGAVEEIIRGKKWESSRMTELEAESEGEKRTVRMRISQQSYDISELETLSRELCDELETMIPGEGNTLDHVTDHMYFPESVEGYPFLLRWSVTDREMLSEDGLVGIDIPKEGWLARISLQITEEEHGFKAEHIFYAMVYPSSESDAFWSRLEKKLETLEKDTRGMDSYVLPDSFEGRELLFHEKRTKKSGLFFLLGMVGAILIATGQKQEEEKKKKSKIAEMEKEYPEMVSRMAMLIGTGMTITGAFKRIAGEYGRQKQEKEKPLYEELMMTCREMETGIPETTAYRNMGKRCRMSCMTRFAALLNQYTKSGAAGLKHALHEETRQALKERQERAKKRGEEAGTKLLLPMTFMLILIMIMIMIPAFTSFGI